MKLSTVTGMNNMDPYDRHAVCLRVLEKVLQELSFRHPRGNYTKLGDVKTCAQGQDHVGMV